MNKQIRKFPISPYKTAVEMPLNAEILTIQVQNGKPCIWALVSPENPKALRHFEIYGTGHDVYCDMGVKRKYINTFQLENGSIVFHLFERIN